MPVIVAFCFISLASSVSTEVLFALANFSAICGNSSLVGIGFICPFLSLLISSGNLPFFARNFLKPLSSIEEPKMVYKTTRGTLVQTS